MIPDGACWAVVFLLAISAVSCGPAGQETGVASSAGPETSPGERTGDWLVFGDTTEPTSLNCIRTSERAARQICRLVADSLVDFDEHLEFIPRLAESFEASDDGLTFTFALRSSVTWHDGQPFTARDVLYSIDLMKGLDPEQEVFRTYFGPLAEVTIVDDHAIRARYEEPYADALVGWREMLIMPAHKPFDPQGSTPLDTAPLGTGPFRFVRWETQQEIVLDANEDYFAGRPYLDRYVHRFIPSLDALQAAAAAGQIDVVQLPSSWLRENSPPSPDLPFRVETYPTRSVQMIYWNLDGRTGLFRDSRVRRAMTMLLDRQGYVTHVHGGLYRTVATPFDVWGAEGRLEPHPYSPADAARLLDEAGIVDRDGDGVRDTEIGPMSFTLLYHGARPVQREIGSLLERAAAGIGVDIKLLGLEWAVLRPRVYSQDFDAAIYVYGLEPRPDPYAYFHSSKIGSGFNLGAYRSEEFDRLSEAARRALDPVESARLFTEMQLLFHQDQPSTAVAAAGGVLAVHKRFRTPPLTTAGWWNWYPGILQWWVPSGERKYH